MSSRSKALAILTIVALAIGAAPIMGEDARVDPEPPATLPELPAIEAGQSGLRATRLDASRMEAGVRGHSTPSDLKADAGDDIPGLVGRQVTLNGVRSEPRGKIGYRWLQVGGPKVRLKLEDGYVYSFVPTAPGVYRFALVVAAGSEISEPATVSVSVGAPTANIPAALPVDAAESIPMEEAARAALASTPGGADAAGLLADAFDGVADRMGLYRSYGDVFQELTHRLERLLPADRTSRLAWDERLFAPLTARLISAMRAEGLDLRQASGQKAEMTTGQRALLAEQFRAMAEGFRATMPAR